MMLTALALGLIYVILEFYIDIGIYDGKGRLETRKLILKILLSFAVIAVFTFICSSAYSFIYLISAGVYFMLAAVAGKIIREKVKWNKASFIYLSLQVVSAGTIIIIQVLLPDTILGIIMYPAMKLMLALLLVMRPVNEIFRMMQLCIPVMNDNATKDNKNFRAGRIIGILE